MKVKVSVSQSANKSDGKVRSQDKIMSDTRERQRRSMTGKRSGAPLSLPKGAGKTHGPDSFETEKKQTADRLFLVAVRQSMEKGFDDLVAKNARTHDIESFNVDVKDYPQHTSTVGEETVQLVVTLTLNKKRK
jgi:hypothetical protein